jgi:hypothetical protein
MSKDSKAPIMSPEQEKFMASEGLVQWTAGVIAQAGRIAGVPRRASMDKAEDRRARIHTLHCEAHYFVTAAWKLLEFRAWASRLGLFATIDFSEIDKFSKDDIRDLRNMREHVVNYFEGKGYDKDRWMIETPEFKADASTMVGTKIGGRLDWDAFSQAATRLLPSLLKEPIPFPPRDVPNPQAKH